MKLRKFIHTVLGGLLFSACTSTTTSGTSEEPVLPDNGPVPISFGSALTRAVVENGPDGKPVGMSAFSVWGWYSPTSSATGTPVEVFNGTKVQPDGSYTDTRYWTDGMTYQFYAIHPHGLTASATTRHIEITGFTTASRGTGTQDLMTAVSDPISYTTQQGANPVKLTFNHELTRVKFSAAAQGKDAVILKNISIKGFYNMGNYQKAFQNNQWQGAWTFTDPRQGEITEKELAVQGSTPPSGNTTDDTTQGYVYVDLFEGDLLLIPQDITDDITIKATMVYPNQIIDEITMESILNKVGITRWEKGMSYHYKVVLPAAMEKPTISVTVEPWDIKNIYPDLN